MTWTVSALEAPVSGGEKVAKRDDRRMERQPKGRQRNFERWKGGDDVGMESMVL